MTYKVSTIGTVEVPFNQSTISADAYNAQMDTHTASWVDPSTLAFEGKGWVHGTLLAVPPTNNTLRPIHAWAINGPYATSQNFWGFVQRPIESDTNSMGITCDDSHTTYASSVQWLRKGTAYNNNFPTTSTRSRINVMRIEP